MVGRWCNSCMVNCDVDAGGVTQPCTSDVGQLGLASGTAAQHHTTRSRRCLRGQWVVGATRTSAAVRDDRVSCSAVLHSVCCAALCCVVSVGGQQRHTGHALFHFSAHHHYRQGGGDTQGERNAV